MNFELFFNDVKEAFDALDHYRNIEKQLHRMCIDENGIRHSHSLEYDWSTKEPYYEGYQYSAFIDSSDASIQHVYNYRIRTVNQENLPHSQIYVSPSGKIYSYRFIPQNMDDFIIRFKIQAGIPAEEYKISEVLKEEVYFMLSTIMDIPSIEDFKNLYIFSQKVCPLLMRDKMVMEGSFPSIFIQNHCKAVLGGV
ncbi:hypothetical protein AAGG91_002866 [Salmonella enterica]